MAPAAFCCAPGVLPRPGCLVSSSSSRTPLQHRRSATVVAVDSSVTTTSPDVNHHNSPIDLATNGSPSPPAFTNPVIPAHDSPDAQSALLDDLGIDPTKPFSMSIAEIAELVETCDDAGLADFRFAHGDFSVEVTRPGGVGFDKEGNLNEAPLSQSNVQLVQEEPVYLEPETDEEEEEDVAVEDEQTESVQVDAVESVDDPDQIYDSDFVVTSNRVGFFFCGAKNKPPLVNVGDTVAYNQPVCIIEQLGQQYVYLSEAAGKVVKVFVEDGDAVEYGSKIMVIRPD